MSADTRNGPEAEGREHEQEQDWRGVSQVDDAEAEERESAGRLGGGSRRLLGELLAPYKRAIKILILVVIVENAARLSIPYLVKEGIDSGIPPIRATGDLGPLFLVVGLMLVATLTQAVTRQLFLVRSGRIGQDVLFRLRGRVFRRGGCPPVRRSCRSGARGCRTRRTRSCPRRGPRGSDR